MNVVAKSRMTLAEFLAWEERQEGRFEFNGREPEEMVGGTERHTAIKLRLYVALMTALHDTGFELFDSDMKTETAGRIRYPDAFVAPGPLQPGGTVRRDPVVIFEVLSDSTALKDMTIKNAEYRATPSVRRYVMLEQHRVAATVFERVGEDWVGHLLVGRESVLKMPEIGISLALGTIYAGVPTDDDAETTDTETAS